MEKVTQESIMLIKSTTWNILFSWLQCINLTALARSSQRN